MSHHPITRALLPALTGLLLGVLALGPALGRGYVLVYDMVFLSGPPPTRAMFGLSGAFPRQVPSDALAAALSHLLPGDIAQKSVLLLIFMLAAWGAAAVTPDPRLIPRTATALFYVWNPFVAERLLLGQWALLLGYAGLPWALMAAARSREPGGRARLVRALVPAAAGGFAALNVSALVVAATAWFARVPSPRGRWLSSSHAPESHTSQSHAPEPHAPEAQAPEAQAPRSHVSESQASESHAPGSHVSEMHAPELSAFETGSPPHDPEASPSHRTDETPEHGPETLGRDPDTPECGPETPERGPDTPVRGVEGVGGARSRPWRGVAVALGVLAVLALPWLVPGFLTAGGEGTDPAGVGLFAARADTPFGALGSLVSLGGAWNAETVPAGFQAWPAALGRLLLSLAAIWSFCRMANRRPEMQGLGVAAALGFGLAALGITEPGRAALRGLIDLWPGFGVLRDAQVYIAPLALLEAVGFGLLVAWVVTGPSDRVGRAALGAILVAAPVALLPGLAWGASGRLVPVDYPAEWGRMRAIVADDPVPGRVLALPWGAYRKFRWNGGRTVLDPLPRALSRQVVQDDGLQVGNVSLHPENPLSRRAAAILAVPGPITKELARAGYRYVIIEKPDTGGVSGRLAGARLVLDGRDLAVYRIPGNTEPPGTPATQTALVVSGDVFTIGLVLWAIAVPMRRTGHGKGQPPCAS